MSYLGTIGEILKIGPENPILYSLATILCLIMGYYTLEIIGLFLTIPLYIGMCILHYIWLRRELSHAIDVGIEKDHSFAKRHLIIKNLSFLTKELIPWE